MDWLTSALLVISVAVLAVAVLFSLRALQVLKYTKRALKESASVLEAVVSSISSRMDLSNMGLVDLRDSVYEIMDRTSTLKEHQTSLRSAQGRLLQHLAELFMNDRRLLFQLEEMKRLVTAIRSAPSPTVKSAFEAKPKEILLDRGLKDSLNETEMQVIQILLREGSKEPPEICRRLKKSREHTARLLQKLYLAGYMQRDSSRLPYKYSVSEMATVRFGLDRGQSAKSFVDQV